MKKAHNLGISPNEETITELNLVELGTKYPNQIKTQNKFSRYQESKTGADWDWELWLGSGNLWLPLSIQAKKLNPKTLKYEELNYQPQKSPMTQMDTLINNSLLSMPPKIPIYVFYNYWDSKKFHSPWLYPLFPRSIHALGCGISPALTIKFSNKRSNKLADISKVMYPWNCLICCQGFSKRPNHSKTTPLPLRALNFIKKASVGKGGKQNFPEKELNFIQEKAPDHIQKIIEGKKLSEEDWNKIKTNRIAVITEEYSTKNFN